MLPQAVAVQTWSRSCWCQLALLSLVLLQLMAVASSGRPAVWAACGLTVPWSHVGNPHSPCLSLTGPLHYHLSHRPDDFHHTVLGLRPASDPSLPSPSVGLAPECCLLHPWTLKLHPRVSIPVSTPSLIQVLSDSSAKLTTIWDIHICILMFLFFVHTCHSCIDVFIYAKCTPPTPDRAPTALSWLALAYNGLSLEDN